jgi:hypothetical protein
MILSLLAAAAILFAAAPTQAEVVSRDENGFTLRFSTTAEIDPADIPGALQALPDWWEASHTYSGDSKNLSLDLTPGGCWCEKLPDNPAFDHGRTVSVAPDRIVFDAPFGPLRGKAAKAELIVTWPGAGRGWAPTWTFVVEGPGLGAMADGVDRVMATGFQRWMHHLEYGEAPDA